MYSITEVTLPKAYHEALRFLEWNGDRVDCKAWNTSQIETPITFTVTEPLQEPMISRLFPGGFYELEQYVEEMVDGILDFEVDKGNWAYTYHQRIAEQLPLVVDILRKDASSRRAVIDIRDWQHDIGSDSPACLQNIQFFIRNGKLDMYVLFRSNDAVKATFMNAFALIMLQKRVADELCVEVGTYTHTANSFHCYEKDLKTLVDYVDAINMRPLNALTYCYKGDWKELMDDCKADIARKVQELKGR